MKKTTQNPTQSPDKGLAINACLQSAAPPIVPPVTVVEPNKCLTRSKNSQATANTASPSIYGLQTACWEEIRLGLRHSFSWLKWLSVEQKQEVNYSINRSTNRKYTDNSLTVINLLVF